MPVVTNAGATTNLTGSTMDGRWVGHGILMWLMMF